MRAALSMRGRVNRATARLLAGIGGLRAVARVAEWWRGSRRLQVLTYHRVNDERHPFFPGLSPRVFEAQIALLGRSATVLALDEAVERLDRGDLPPAAVALTFDDGYRDNYLNAFPILRRHGVPATIFLATGSLAGGPPLWHDVLFDAFVDTRMPEVDIEGRRVGLATREERQSALLAMLEQARRARPTEREALLASQLERLGVEARAPDRRMLDWAEIREMADAGITFGAHTVSHPILTTLTPDELRREVTDVKREIESRLSREVTLFAYPNGGPRDFDARSKDALRESGYRAAVTTIWGSNGPESDPFELRRVGAWDDSAPLSLLRLAVDRARC